MDVWQKLYKSIILNYNFQKSQQIKHPCGCFFRRRKRGGTVRSNVCPTSHLSLYCV